MHYFSEPFFDLFEGNILNDFAETISPRFRADTRPNAETVRVRAR